MKLILVNDIKEKILLIKSNFNPKLSYFATKIVVKHNKFILRKQELQKIVRFMKKLSFY